MLKLNVNTRRTGDVRLDFEHSLLSLSKWEEETGKCFLDAATKSNAEWIRYFSIMLELTSPELDPDLVLALSPAQQDELIKYINSTPGATSSPPRTKESSKKQREAFTAEIIYAQMTMLRIPWEAQTWHVNRLLVTIAWIAFKQTPEKDQVDKRSVREKLTDWAAMNAENRKRFNSNG